MITFRDWFRIAVGTAVIVGYCNALVIRFVMSKPTYSIYFGDAVSPEVIDRIRNLAEDIFRALRDDGLGTVENMDTAINEVIVTVSATRHVGDVLKIIRSLLGRHHFDNATVRRVER